MRHKTAVSVLVSPMDWGLGHATRCIPIINELLKHPVRILIAASGPQQVLLKQEFPLLEYLEIPGYNIRYRAGFWLKWSLILRIPSLLKQMRREKKWLADCLQKHAVDGVISDNRYGLYNKNTFCVFLSHQLNIQSGLHGNRWPFSVARFADRHLLKWNYACISKFSEMLGSG